MIIISNYLFVFKLAKKCLKNILQKYIKCIVKKYLILRILSISGHRSNQIHTKTLTRHSHTKIPNQFAQRMPHSSTTSRNLRGPASDALTILILEFNCLTLRTLKSKIQAVLRFTFPQKIPSTRKSRLSHGKICLQFQSLRVHIKRFRMR